MGINDLQRMGTMMGSGDRAATGMERLWALEIPIFCDFWDPGGVNLAGIASPEEAKAESGSWK